MRIKSILLLTIGIIFTLGSIIPQNLHMPVKDANHHDFNSKSFWHYPWGKSGTHKGIDIFAQKGTLIRSSTLGIVLFTGSVKRGGNVVLILGPKWRLHYYAHIDQIPDKIPFYLSQTSLIGTVGTSGNATGNQPHLHYSIMTLIPYPWRIDKSPQGWKKMFYLNPGDFLIPDS